MPEIHFCDRILVLLAFLPTPNTSFYACTIVAWYFWVQIDLKVLQYNFNYGPIPYCPLHLNERLKLLTRFYTPLHAHKYSSLNKRCTWSGLVRLAHTTSNQLDHLGGTYTPASKPSMVTFFSHPQTIFVHHHILQCHSICRHVF